MSTPVASARLRAEGSVRVLKAMMMPFDASASMTSESLTGPVAAWMTLTLTSLRTKPLERALDRLGASADVCLQDDDEFLELAGADLVEERVQVDVGVLGLFAASRRRFRSSTICRATRSSAMTRSFSPASGTSARPMITAGVDGPASLNALAAYRRTSP